MPFDVSNPADVLALRNEFLNDPVSQGYSSPVDYLSAGATRKLLSLIRSDDNGGATNSTTEFSGEDLLESVIASPTEYASEVTDHLTQSGLRVQFLESMFRYGSENIPQRFHSSLLGIYRV